MSACQRLQGLLGVAAVLVAAGSASLLLGRAGAEEARRLWATRTGLGFDDLVVSLALGVLALTAAWLCLATLLTATALLLRCSTGLTATVAAWIRPPLLRRALIAACGAVALTAPSTAPALAMPLAGVATPCRPLSGFSPAPLPAPHRPVPPPGPDHARVVVRAGDTLWAIASEQLPGRASDVKTATAWPLWFRLNRARLGPDPDLIHPGTRLRVPPRFARTREDRS